MKTDTLNILKQKKTLFRYSGRLTFKQRDGKKMYCNTFSFGRTPIPRRKKFRRAQDASDCGNRVVERYKSLLGYAIENSEEQESENRNQG